MLFIYLLFIWNKFVYLHPKTGSQYSRIDCYKSFSNPTLYFRLFHYYPTGPLYLYVTFSSSILYLHTDKRLNNFRCYHFKKYFGPCETTNIIFSTNNNKIREMTIMIKIYLTSNRNFEIADIFYTLKEGFVPESILLVCMNKNFALEAKVSYTEPNNFTSTVTDYLSFNLYLLYLTSKHTNICVITENSYAVVIKPKYNDYSHKGYIIGIETVFYDAKSSYNTFKYVAFECYDDEDRTDEKTVFIHDKPLNTLINMSVLYLKFNFEDKIIKKASFTVQDIKFQNLYIKYSLLPNVKIIFIMEKQKVIKSCHGERNIIIYKSKADAIIYIKEDMKIEVMPKIWQSISIIDSSLTNC